MTSTRIKSALYSILLCLIVLLGIGGCDQSSPTTSKPGVVMRVLDPTLEQFAPMWQQEISRRFPNAVGVLVHGGDFVEGSWVIGDWQYRSGQHVRPVSAVVQEAQAMYPNRTIVLLACNPGHLKLNIPNVYYAPASVFCVPDRFTDSVQVTPEMLTRTLLFGMRAKAEAAKHRPALGGRWQQDEDIVGNIYEFSTDN